MSVVAQPRFCDLDTVMKEISTACTKTFMYTPLKKKKNKGLDLTKFVIQDGVIKFNVLLSPNPSCCCNSNNTSFCPHVLKIFVEYFKITPEIISYLHISTLYDKLIELLKLNNINTNYDETLSNVLQDYFSDECGICCEKLLHKKYKMRLFKCDICLKYVHTSCMEQWYRQKSQPSTGVKVIKKNGCIYCREKL